MRISRYGKYWLVVLMLSLSGCQEDFSPKGPFENQFVIYSVITTARDLQFVRVYTNYDVPGFDPLENTVDHPVTGARVVVSGPGGIYVFRDTLIPRQDKSRYASPIAAYVANWRPRPGETYVLDVSADNIGAATASVTLPQKSSPLDWSPNTMILDSPDSVKQYSSFYGYGKMTQQTKAYVYQMTIEYDVLRVEGWRRESVVIPTLTTVYKSYTNASGYCSKSTYVETLEQIAGRYKNTKLTFRKLVFRLLQLEENWYNYYSTVRQFQDPFSIRLDEPDFTNLSNGYGLFAGSTMDSLIHVYPDNFKYHNR
jgi:hypothetical protein